MQALKMDSTCTDDEGGVEARGGVYHSTFHFQ